MNDWWTTPNPAFCDAVAVTVIVTLILVMAFQIFRWVWTDKTNKK